MEAAVILLTVDDNTEEGSSLIFTGIYMARCF